MSTVKLKATDGSTVEFVDKIIGAGGMKDVYFSPDRSYVVGFFRAKQDAAARDRLENIVGKYRQGIFGSVGGEYWKDMYCWPEKIVEHDGKLGVVVPAYAKKFFFDCGSSNGDTLKIKGKEKEGKWFASPFLKYGQLDPRERGDWLAYLRICIKIARSVRRLHSAGLAHSDLSYKNVLIDPRTGSACIIDIDGLVVPGKFPPDVVGTPDFIAPEVMRTLNLSPNDANRKLPSRGTDQHALAVLIYMYLLNRHPLRGRKVHDCDDEHHDEELAMGEKALFIENPSDTSNRYDAAWLKRDNPNRFKFLMPWQDIDALPYKVLGPYLSELVKRAFIDGLHNPMLRPSADDWEDALVKTSDLLQQCTNSSCSQHWFVFDNTQKPTCPFCKTPFKGILPILNLYSKRGNNPFKPENYRVMVFNGVRLYAWHVNRNVFPNEKLTPEQTKSLACFQFHNGDWYLRNEGIPGMKDISDGGKVIGLNQIVKLTEGRQILLSEEDGGRLIHVQMVHC